MVARAGPRDRLSALSGGMREAAAHFSLLSSAGGHDKESTDCGPRTGPPRAPRTADTLIPDFQPPDP